MIEMTDHEKKTAKVFFDELENGVDSFHEDLSIAVAKAVEDRLKRYEADFLAVVRGFYHG